MREEDKMAKDEISKALLHFETFSFLLNVNAILAGGRRALKQSVALRLSDLTGEAR